MAYVTVSMLLLLVVPGTQAAGKEPGNNFPLGKGKVPAIFTFGDSTVDSGTNTFLPDPAFLANFTPYGQTYFHRPTGRFCDGRLWVDRLARYLDLPVMKAFLNPKTTDYSKGVDFASAGSGNLESTKATVKSLTKGNVANTDEQLQWFLQVKESLVGSIGAKATEKLLGRSIFILSTGNNDISYGYILNSTMTELYTPDQVTSLMIEAIYNTTKTLFDEGARKIVLSALGPLGCLPTNVASNNGSCVESVNNLVKLFNSKLPALLDRINANCEGARVIYTDSYDTVEGFIKNGTEYGFSRGSYGCCGTGDYNGQPGACGSVDVNGTALYNLCSKEELKEYVFWDNAHITDKTNGILAHMFINGENVVVKPYNISALCD
ncbi:hypothetical protein R1flu_012983 [Riccia fluitans]|uniref:GDSL esterase/lipase n=1 Tax=Riccia fluitans TaxID=41844 RepID=A0ABD1ZC70_9MARC